MAQMWMGGSKYPQKALYFNVFGDSEGIDGKGTYQIIISDPYEIGDIRFDKSRIFISPSSIPPRYSAIAEVNTMKIEGLGSFDHFPSQQEILDRWYELSEQEAVQVDPIF